LSRHGAGPRRQGIAHHVGSRARAHPANRAAGGDGPELLDFHGTRRPNVQGRRHLCCCALGARGWLARVASSGPV
jgi:hypothetical protein